MQGWPQLALVWGSLVMQGRGVARGTMVTLVPQQDGDRSWTPPHRVLAWVPIPAYSSVLCASSWGTKGDRSSYRDRTMHRQTGPCKGLMVEDACLGCTVAFRQEPSNRRLACQGEGLGFITGSRGPGAGVLEGLRASWYGYLA